MEQVIVTIDPQGGISYVVKGVKGRGCKELTKAIDQLGTVTESKNTLEYNSVPNQLGQRIGK